ncbi:hypothetical protein OP10G_0786 [Fimbriimonas ginsengisoli Gsoil 348]|uniref:Uncharacterized protein n=1 Tax=Fimbriimonas ginsengisoli Gsoil 348 TaxID=661478 RepID=A0A068NRD3_FIMGI|nr:hypothetical protein OP10G_0786 [Fimbriimonas ginsengisoli Gsoil 348]
MAQPDRSPCKSVLSRGLSGRSPPQRAEVRDLGEAMEPVLSRLLEDREWSLRAAGHR